MGESLNADRNGGGRERTRAAEGTAIGLVTKLLPKP
jgi:hypothetical protein